MSIRLLGISGRKQSGKNSIANFLVGLNMSSIGIIQDRWAITDEGELHISDIHGNTDYEGIFDITRRSEVFENWRSQYIDPYIKTYSFADLLKLVLCGGLFGLDTQLLYGSDADKNKPTTYKWEDMPGVYTNKKMYDLSIEANPELAGVLFYHAPGVMSHREFIQYMGSDVMRRVYPNIWIDNTLKLVESDNPIMAVVTDVRFPNEVDKIKQAGGKVLRLTRDPYHDDHISENSLDKENYDWGNFDYVIDNANMTIPEQNKAIYTTLDRIGWVPEIKEF